MSSKNWSTDKLENLIQLGTTITYGVVKPGDEDASGVKFIRSGDVYNGKILVNNLRTIRKEISEQYKRTQLQGGELVISLVGNPGEVAIVPEELKGANLARQVGVVRLKETVEKEFIKYFLMSPQGREKLFAKSVGSVQQVINLHELRDLIIPLPEISIQRGIASILSSLDDKIELNHQTNQTLEAMAQAIYREWFVDFNFPGATGEMRNSKLGPIPKGWQVGELGEYINFIKGRKPKETSEKHVEGFLPQILIETLDSGKYIYADPENMIVCNENDLVMVMDGASSGRTEFGIKGIVGSTLAIIKRINFDFQYFLHQFLKLKEEDIKANPTGSSIPHADKHKINDYDFVVPEYGVLQKYERVVSTMYQIIKKNKVESQALNKIRDNLLPKLMSGEIEV